MSDCDTRVTGSERTLLIPTKTIALLNRVNRKAMYQFMRNRMVTPDHPLVQNRFTSWGKLMRYSLNTSA